MRNLTRQKAGDWRMRPFGPAAAPRQHFLPPPGQRPHSPGPLLLHRESSPPPRSPFLSLSLSLLPFLPSSLPSLSPSLVKTNGSPSAANYALPLLLLLLLLPSSTTTATIAHNRSINTCASPGLLHPFHSGSLLLHIHTLRSN